MLSTVGNTGLTKVSVSGLRSVAKPNVQIMYNKNMGGVDLFDKFCSTYPYGNKSMKWYHTIWHFVIVAGLINGCIAYNMQKDVKPLTHIKYRQEVIDGLLANWDRSASYQSSLWEEA